jgi:hypothetical protein
MRVAVSANRQHRIGCISGMGAKLWEQSPVRSASLQLSASAIGRSDGEASYLPPRGGESDFNTLAEHGRLAARRLSVRNRKRGDCFYGPPGPNRG